MVAIEKEAFGLLSTMVADFTYFNYRLCTIVKNDLKFFQVFSNTYRLGGRPRDVIANELDYVIVVSEFEHQSHYHVQFLTNTLVRGMNPLIPQL